MIKKITTVHLRLGMYIHDLNCGWMAHKFMRSNFFLNKESDLNKIIESGIQELYIDNSKGWDAPGLPEEEASADVTRQLEAIIGRHPRKTIPPNFPDAHANVMAIYSEATDVVASVMADVRLGRQLAIERLSPIVYKLMESLLSNTEILISLNRIKNNDKYTFQHSISVATLLIILGRALNLEQESLYQLGMGGLVHDIGKIRIPDEILNKPSSLTDKEFEVMKTHVAIGIDILGASPGSTNSMLEITGHHHERIDGSGYPCSLSGFNISLFGRMAAIADIYDAITSDRVYRGGMDPAFAMRKIFEWAKYHLDTDLIQQFIHAIGIYPVGSLVRLASQQLAVVIHQGEDLLRPTVRIIFDAKTQSMINPRDLDLGKGRSYDHILGPESPDLYGLKPDRYIHTLT